MRWMSAVEVDSTSYRRNRRASVRRSLLSTESTEHSHGGQQRETASGEDAKRATDCCSRRRQVAGGKKGVRRISLAVARLSSQ